MLREKAFLNYYINFAGRIVDRKQLKSDMHSYSSNNIDSWPNPT